MKLYHAALVAAAVTSLFTAVGCESSPKTTKGDMPPAITADATRKDMVEGESVLVTAQTVNLIGAKNVHWTISPAATNAKINPDPNSYNTAGYFTADQPGVYVITATADAGDGRMVSSDLTITVHGRNRGVASEK